MERKEAIYTRQSVSKSDNISIDTQIEVCKRFSENGIVYTDKGYSGKNTERPQLQQLIDEIKHGKISKVICYRLDRISRNIVDFYNLYEVMEKHDCSFQSATETFDTSNSMGRAMMGILAIFAQMERENIQQRVRDSYYNRIEDGRWAGGNAPFGFDVGKRNEVPTLVPNNDIEAVKEAFHLYAFMPNISLYKISEILRNKNYGNGMVINQATISRFLRNPIYCVADKSLYQYYKTLGVNFVNDETEWNAQHSANLVGKYQSTKNDGKRLPPSEQTIYLTNIEGIISSEIFIMVQNRLSKNLSFGRSNESKTALKELSGLLKCGHCGYAVKMRTKYGSLFCDGRAKLKNCTESFKGIRLNMIQAQVDEQMEKKLSNLRLLYEEQRQKRIKLLNEIKVLEKEIDNFIEAIAKAPEISVRLTEAIQQRQDLIRKKELEYRTNDTYEILQYRMGAFVEDIDTINYKEAPTEYKHMLCKIFIKRVLLFEGGKIEIEWNEL